MGFTSGERAAIGCRRAKSTLFKAKTRLFHRCDRWIITSSRASRSAPSRKQRVGLTEGDRTKRSARVSLAVSKPLGSRPKGSTFGPLGSTAGGFQPASDPRAEPRESKTNPADTALLSLLGEAQNINLLKGALIPPVLFPARASINRHHFKGIRAQVFY